MSHRSGTVAGGGGAKAAAHLRSTGGGGGGNATSSIVAARRGRSILAASSASSSSSESSDDDEDERRARAVDSEREESSDDQDDDDDDDDDDLRARPHPQPSSDSDTDPLEPPPPKRSLNPSASPTSSPVSSTSINSQITPVFPVTDPMTDAKGRPFPSISDEEALQIVLDSNGITREEHAKNPHAKSYLEVFQINKYRRIQGLTSFGPSIKHLEIMHQNLVQIEGLQTLVNLEILYLNNNCIKKISGLNNNTKLQELYLGENQITKLENLSCCPNLTVLSLYDNAIPAIEGLEELVKLKKLNLARNKIEEIGNSLDHLTSLIELNLADNQIGTFNQIRHLSRLKQLEILYLNDPHHGDNPVCNLCNYHTYALYHLQHLQVLDTIKLTEEATVLAEATFLKKQMYYNMRIKVCKGNTSNLLKKANDICKQRLTSINATRRELLRAYKLILSQIAEHSYECDHPNSAGSDEPSTEVTPLILPEPILEQRKEVLEKLLLGYNQQIMTLSNFMPNFARKLNLLSEQLIQRMILELETGGNLRFEDGILGQESWVLSCIHFLHTHLATPSLSKKFGLGTSPSLRIRRVTKIHNRALRNKFDECLESKMEVNGDGSPVVSAKSKPDLHYAFYSNWTNINSAAGANQAQAENVDVGNPALIQAAHNGFAPTSSSSSNPSSTSFTPDRTSPGLILTNCVLYADLPRLLAQKSSSAFSSKSSPSTDPLHFLKKYEIPPTSPSNVAGSAATRDPTITGGEIIIAKVYLGNSQNKPANANGQLSLDGKDPFGYFPPLKAIDYPNNVDSVVEDFPNESLGSSSSNSGSNSTNKALGSPSNRRRPSDATPHEENKDGEDQPEEMTKLKRIHIFSRPLVLPEYIISFDYVSGNNEADAAAGSYSQVAIKDDYDLLKLSGNFIGLREPLIDLINILSKMDRYDAEVKHTFQSQVIQPLPKLSPRHDTLTTIEKGQQAKLSKLAFVNLSDLGLKTIPTPLVDFTGPSLKVLILNFNSISKLDGVGLERLVNLERLELGYNAIKRVAAGVLSPMRSLTYLSLEYNLLSSSNDIATIIADASKLEVLDLRGNAGLSKSNSSTAGKLSPSSYQAQLLKGLSQLKQLDLITVESSMRSASGQRELSAGELLTLHLNPLFQYQGTFQFNDGQTSTNTSSAVTTDKKITTSSASNVLSPYGTPSTSSTTTATSLSIAAPSNVSALNDSLLIQQCFVDRDSCLKLRGGSSSAASASGANRRAMNIYTRIRLSQFLAESPIGGKATELPTQIPTQYYDQILECELDHQHLTALPASSAVLGRFTNLRKLSLYDNSLTAISGLETLGRLEELSLEENSLTKIDGLSGLQSLSKLDLGKNKLASIDVPVAFHGLCATLTQLSLEDNYLKTLVGFELLTNLMELYLGNNQLDNSKELLYLKDLPKLLILDLSGNTLTFGPDYRLWAIYTLKKLKVLDGSAIEASEVNASKEQYSGRLTEELLAEILGHNFFKHIENLDLSGAKIRNMEVISSERFCNLRVLVLDNNLISDLSTLSPLSLLRVLRLNRNRITSIPFHESSSRGLLVRCFPHLEVLELGYNKIQSIPALHLKGLLELRVLTLESNELTKVEGLQGLPNLQQLVLAKNKIKRFEAGGTGVSSMVSRSFAGLNELRGLQLEENGLRSLVGLGSLPKLRSLFLAYNRLSELNELDHLATDRCSPVLQEITLRNNPLARKHLYRATLIRRISPSLQMIDGREITQEEREKTEQIFANSSQMVGGSTSLGPNGEPLIGLGGGMPNGAVYFYANDVPTPQQMPQRPPPVDKVPIKMQSFSLGGFMDSGGGSGGGSNYSHSQQAHNLGNQYYQNPSIQNALGGLGIGGVSIGPNTSGHAAQSHGIAHMNLNLSSNMGLGPHRSSFSTNSSGGMSGSSPLSPTMSGSVGGGVGSIQSSLAGLNISGHLAPSKPTIGGVKKSAPSSTSIKLGRKI